MTLTELEEFLRQQSRDFKRRYGYEWPDCAIADCPYKASKRLNSDKCDPHTTGRIPLPIEDYYDVVDDDAKDRQGFLL